MPPLSTSQKLGLSENNGNPFTQNYSQSLTDTLDTYFNAISLSEKGSRMEENALQTEKGAKLPTVHELQ